MAATISANNLVNYNKVYYNHSMEEWVEIVNKYNSTANNWTYYKLQAGTFGFDNIVLSLYYLFENSKISDLTESNIEKLSDYIHEGWIINYTYWRDNEPWTKSDDSSFGVAATFCSEGAKKVEDYIKPYSPLGDKRRNDCAATKYNDLSKEEKEKDRIIVKCVLQNIQ